MTALKKATLLGFALVLVYLLAYPTDVSPVAWTAPKYRGLTGRFASNQRLAKARRVAEHLHGPEALTASADGHIYTGTLSGDIVTIDPDSNQTKRVANTGGRPLGMKLRSDGSIVVADAYKGLLHVSTDGHVTSLATGHAGLPFEFTDDLDLTPRDTVVFTDASSRFDLHVFELDALEHRPSGRLLEYDFKTKQTRLLLDRLVFANGVAVSSDGSYALVNETWAYRVRRVFLAGPRKGQHEVVIDNLPGFPDNITYDRTRDLFWVALGAPRDAALDLLAPYPSVRKIIARLPQALRPKPKLHAMAVAIKGDGSLVDFLDDSRDEAYAPVTTVFAHRGELWLGSFKANGIARIPY